MERRTCQQGRWDRKRIPGQKKKKKKKTLNDIKNKSINHKKSYLVQLKSVFLPENGKNSLKASLIYVNTTGNLSGCFHAVEKKKKPGEKFVLYKITFLKGFVLHKPVLFSFWILLKLNFEFSQMFYSTPFQSVLPAPSHYVRSNSEIIRFRHLLAHEFPGNLLTKKSGTARKRVVHVETNPLR